LISRGTRTRKIAVAFIAICLPSELSGMSQPGWAE
jgi:hypothetical protein